MTTRLLLVRHGETDSNAEGRSQGRLDQARNALNARGRRQVTALAVLLAEYAPAAIYSSPSGRAQATAAAVAERLRLPVIVDARLAELDHGDLDGLTGVEMREKAPEFLLRWRDEDPTYLRVPGGETMGEAQARMVAAAAAIAEAYPGGAVVAVSHNLALRSLLCHALGVPLSAFRRFRHGLAALSVVDVHEDGQFELVTLNERCHLLDLEDEVVTST